MENPSSAAKIVGVVALLLLLGAGGWYATKDKNSVSEVTYQTVQSGSQAAVSTGTVTVSAGAEVAYVNRIDGDVTRKSAAGSPSPS